MSVDTVRLTTHITLDYMGWYDYQFQTLRQDGERPKIKYVTVGDRSGSPRVTYYDDSHLLGFEVSLPKFLMGDNYHLLDDIDIDKACQYAVDYLQDRLRAKLPPWEYWGVSRLDCVYSWQVGHYMSGYLHACGSVPIRDYTRSPYHDAAGNQQGHSWHSKNRKVNAYDKGLESGKEEARGLLRVECQNLNYASCANLARREKLPMVAGSLLNSAVARREVARWLDRVGMTGTVQPDDDLLLKIFETLGEYGEAAAIYAFVLGYRRYGTRIKTMMSDSTYKRRMRVCKAHGWLVVGGYEKLPELEI